MKEKIIVTGANGFLGKRVCNKLVQNYEIIPLDKPKTDLTNWDSLMAAVASIEKIDTVIHIAGATDGNKGNFKDNETMAKNMVRLVKEKGIKKLIFVSSNSVNYSQREYANSKRRAEEIIKNGGIDYAIVRPALLIGKDSKEVRQMMDRSSILPIIPLPGGSEGRGSPIGVDNAADFIVGMIGHFDKCRNQTVSIGGKEKLTNHQVMAMLNQVVGIKKPIFDVPAWLVTWISPKYFKSLWADISIDNSLAEKMWGWKAVKITPEEFVS